MEPQRVKERFDRNFFWNVVEGTFVAGGFGLFSLQVFLAAWLTQLGAGPVWVGLLTTAWFAGFALPQPWSAARARPLQSLRPYIMRWIAWQRVAVLALAIAAWTISPDHRTGLIAVTFVAVLLFTTTMGVANPIWLQWIGKVTPPSQRGRLHGTRSLLGGCFGLGAAALAQAALARWAFPYNYAAVFGLSFLFLMMAWCTYLWMTEEPAPELAATPSASAWRGVFVTLSREKEYRRFILMGFVLHLAILMPANYFVTYGLQAGVLSPDKVGLAALAGGLAVMAWSPLLGWIGDRFGNRWLLVVASVCAACSAGFGWCTGWGLPWLFAAVACSSGAVVSATIGMINLVLEFAPPREEAHFASVASPMLAVAGAVSPLAGGVLAERWGYGAMMICALGLSVLSILAVGRFVGFRTRSRPATTFDFQKISVREGEG